MAASKLLLQLADFMKATDYFEFNLIWIITLNAWHLTHFHFIENTHFSSTKQNLVGFLLLFCAKEPNSKYKDSFIA